MNSIESSAGIGGYSTLASVKVTSYGSRAGQQAWYCKAGYSNRRGCDETPTLFLVLSNTDFAMGAYRYVHDCLHRTMSDEGFLGTVSIGSCSYMEMQSEDDGGHDVDIILVTRADGPMGIGGMESIKRILDADELTHKWTTVTVNARVPILKCKIEPPSGSISPPWAVDILHQTVTSDEWTGTPGRIIPLDEAALLLPTHTAINLAIVLRNHLCGESDPKSFNTGSLGLLRRWAKYNHMYGSTCGYPGGSAWAVMLLIFCCTADDVSKKTNNPFSLAGSEKDAVVYRFINFLHNWFVYHSGVPLTAHNVTMLCQHGTDRFGAYANWDGARHSIGRYGRVMCVLPLPTDLAGMAIQECDNINMTSSLGPLQHGVMIWEMRCVLNHNKIVSNRSRLPEADFIFLFTVFGADAADRSAMEGWILHVEARGLLLLTNQLHSQGLCARILYWDAVQEEEGGGEKKTHQYARDDANESRRLPFAVAVWNPCLEAQDVLSLVTTVMGRIEYQYRKEHRCVEAPCSIRIVPILLGEL